MSRKYLFVYLAITIPALFLLMRYFDKLGLVIGGILCFVVVFIAVRVSSGIRQKSIMKDLELYFDCQMEAFIAKAEVLLKKAPLDRSYRVLIKDYMRSAYSFLDNHDKEYELINDRDVMKLASKNVSIKLNWLASLCMYYEGLEMYDDSEKALEELSSHIGILTNPRSISHWDNFVKWRSKHIRFQRTGEGAEECIKLYGMAIAGHPDKKITKVTIAYTMSRYELAMGKTEDARRHLEYLAENGGDTRFARIAKEQLMVNE